MTYSSRRQAALVSGLSKGTFLLFPTRRPPTNHATQREGGRVVGGGCSVSKKACMGVIGLIMAVELVGFSIAAFVQTSLFQQVVLTGNFCQCATVPAQIQNESLTELQS